MSENDVIWRMALTVWPACDRYSAAHKMAARNDMKAAARVLLEHVRKKLFDGLLSTQMTVEDFNACVRDCTDLDLSTPEPPGDTPDQQPAAEPDPGPLQD